MQKLSTPCRMHKMLLIVPLAISSMSCAHATTGTVRSIHDFCLIAKGISFSEAHGADVETAANKYDTTQTVEAVRKHDLAYEATCPTPAPASATPERGSNQ